MKNPKTIKILLADGTPNGIKIAEIGGRVVKAVLVPRNKIKEASNREELGTVGLYFLIGKESEINKPDVYIGEAEHVYKRLLQHNKDGDKDFWNIALCFVSTNNSINKAHVKYLEGYCYELAQQFARCCMVNGSVPAKTQLQENDVADTMDFFDNVKLLMATLGYPIFDDVNILDESESVYICKGPHANAKGKYSDEGMVVYSGSVSRKELTKTAGPWIEKSVKKLVENGILIDNGEKSYIFSQNHIFSSPSIAAAVVLSRRANGWLEWKDEKGNTLDKNERQ